MGHALIRTAAAAALALVAATPALASDPPKRTAKAETRYCIHRAKAGAATTERYCKTRKQWIRQDGVDPERFR